MAPIYPDAVIARAAELAGGTDTPQGVLTAAELAAMILPAYIAADAPLGARPRDRGPARAWDSECRRLRAEALATWAPPPGWAPTAYVAGVATGAAGGPEDRRTTPHGGEARLAWVRVATVTTRREDWSERRQIAGTDGYSEYRETTYEWCLVRAHGWGVERHCVLRRGGVGPERPGLECEVT